MCQIHWNRISTGVAKPNEDPILEATIAYFSVEIALEPDVPLQQWSRSARGRHIAFGQLISQFRWWPSRCFSKGYFHQRLDSSGRQTEEPVEWAVKGFLRG